MKPTLKDAPVSQADESALPHILQLPPTMHAAAIAAPRLEMRRQRGRQRTERVGPDSTTVHILRDLPTVRERPQEKR